MKNNATLLLFFLLNNLLFAQSIQQLTVFPANPTTADSIRIIGDLQFTSGGCQMNDAYFTTSGSSVNVHVRHCPGMLTYICDVTDTVTIGLLPAGNYTLNFLVDVGTYDTNGVCENFTTATQQSVNFTVTGNTAISSPSTAFPKITFVQDSRQLLLSGTTGRTKVRIMDITGRMIFNGFANPGEIPISGLPAQGILIYTLQTTEGKEKAGRIVLQ